ncbi:unnamed protein product, partial [Iphiclides podalirius]
MIDQRLFFCPTYAGVNASKEGYFKSPYRWMLLGSVDMVNPFTLLQDINMVIDSDVVVAKKFDEGEFVLTEVYKIAEGTELIFNTRAIWRATNNNLIDGGSNMINFSIEKEQLNATREKFTSVENGGNDIGNSYLHQDSITKMSYVIVKICFEMLNASEKLIFTHTWGYRDKNGNWQGIIDHLLKKEADLGTLTIFTQERMECIDYIAMVGSTAVRFVFREPPLALLSNIFTLPFTGGVWLAIIVCVLACAIFLYIASKWEATVAMHPTQLNGTWADVLILIIGAVLQQGCTLEPRYAAGRCVTLLLFIALTILYSAYSANIVVLLRAPSSSVRSLPDLLNSPLKLGASDFEYNRYFFKKLNEPIRKAIYDKKIAPKGKKPNFYSMKEGVEKIRRGLFAFHMELNPGYRLIQETYQEEEKCDLVEIDYINEIDPWVPGQKRSPYKDLFKINFIKIRETGIQANNHHRLHVPRPRCSGAISAFSSVGITDMYPAIIATLYGMLLAPAVLILEIFHKRLIREAASLYGVKRGHSRRAVGEREVETLKPFLEMPYPGAQMELQLWANKRASSSNHFSYPYRWLLLSSTGDKSDILRELSLWPTSDLVLATKKNGTFTLNEWHKTSANGPPISTFRGFYDGDFVDVRPTKELYRRRRDLMGHPLTMANVIQDSNTTQYHMEDGLEGQHDATAKISWMVVKLAFQMLNATPQHIFSHRWGYKQNGRWSGMIDDILNNRADLGTNCAVYPERLDVIQYTDTIAPFKVGFIFRQPPLPYVANIFTMPFSTEVWLAVAGCISFSTVVLYLASKSETRFMKAPPQLDGTVSDAMLVTISAFSQQGCTLEPRKASGRMALWVVFAALMALYAAYSANIVVLLQAPSAAVRTLKQLSHSKLTLAANDVDYNRFVFGMYSDPVRVEITNRVKPPKGKPHFYTINEGVEKIRQGLFAFHSIVEPVYRRVEQTFHAMEKCDLVEVDFMLGFDPYVPVKKDSPYLELLRVSFKQIREFGLQSALNRRLQVPKPQCTHRIAAFSSVGLRDLRPVLALMLYGAAMSMLILLLEIITSKVHA